MTETNNRQAREQASFDAMISEGLNSGTPSEMDWDKFRIRALARHERNKTY